MKFLNSPLIVIFLGTSMWAAIHAQLFPNNYLYYDELTTKLKQIANDHPTRTFLYSIGKSVEKRDLWVMAIAKTQPNAHVLLRPEIKFVGNIHGNELSTGEVLLQFIQHLLTNPENDTRVDEILDNMRVHILVSMNPDGAEVTLRESCTSKLGRNNSNSLDLNRNFPDRYFCNDAPQQPETLAVLEWMKSTRFLLSGAFHTGAIVTAYSYENWAQSELSTTPKYMATDDDDVMIYLAKQYGMNHKTMPTAVCDGEKFKDGITNGANWWPPVKGGMMDINYWKFGTKEITMEIGCCFTPPASDMPQIWLENKNSLIEFSRSANVGIRGLVSYQNGLPAQHISVQFDSREPIIKTTTMGEFFAILLPGTYNMTLMLNCDVIHNSIVHVYQSSKPLVFNVTLDDRLYFKAFYYKLDSYAIFCNLLKAPIDCSNSKKQPLSPNSACTFAKFVYSLFFFSLIGSFLIEVIFY